MLLFTTDTDVIQIHIGEDSNVMYVSGAGQALDYQAAFYEGDTLYIAADYVKKYANFDYLVYDEPLHMQVYTEWGAYTEAAVSKRRRCAIRAASRVIFWCIWQQAIW